MVNIKNAQTLVDQIKAHRAMFEMASWDNKNNAKVLTVLNKKGSFTLELENIEDAGTTCGTTLCIAGFATLNSGYRVQYLKEKSWGGGEYVFRHYIDPEGERILGEPAWAEVGAEYLGMDLGYATRLFHYTHDNDGALAILQALADGLEPEEIEALQRGQNSCSCEFCEPEWADDDEYERCTCGCEDDE